MPMGAAPVANPRHGSPHPYDNGRRPCGDTVVRPSGFTRILAIVADGPWPLRGGRRRRKLLLIDFGRSGEMADAPDSKLWATPPTRTPESLRNPGISRGFLHFRAVGRCGTIP